MIAEIEHLINHSMIHDSVRTKCHYVFHRRHDLHHGLSIQLKNTVQDTNLVITQRFLAMPMKLKERLQLCLFVRVPFVRSKDVIEKLCYGPGNGG